MNLALKMRLDAIITRDAYFPAVDMLREHDCTGFFAWLVREKGISYTDIPC